MIGKSRAAGRGAWQRVWCWLGPLCVALLLLTSSLPVRAAAPPTETQKPVPILAYYYIWYNASSWNRAKQDYPLVGRYSSDDPAVMREHIRLAKQAGIDGFIVSWKSTSALNRRLAQLVRIADSENFKLSIIYEGLDFHRNPLPVSVVESDLKYFADHYAHDKAFDMFGKPLVIWSGTWKFGTEDIARVTSPLRARLLILASERSVEGCQRLAGLVDGEAYYWSSADPNNTNFYQQRLDAMSTVTHRQGGLWIAPAAPGFDARMIGGTRVIGRNGGETLRRQMNAAILSSPDAIGIISWNEFSENSYIEPSKKYGSTDLKVLASMQHMPVPSVPDFDSSAPAGGTRNFSGLPLLGALAFLVLACLTVILRRSEAH